MSHRVTIINSRWWGADESYMTVVFQREGDDDSATDIVRGLTMADNVTEEQIREAEREEEEGIAINTLAFFVNDTVTFADGDVFTDDTGARFQINIVPVP